MQSLKIAILSREPDNYSTRRLREAAGTLGHTVKVLNTLKFGILVESSDPRLAYGSKELEHYDAVIPRIGPSVTFYGTAVVRQFEQMGVFCLNNSHAISVSRDKLRSMQVLSRHDVGIVPSVFVRDRQDIIPAIERVGGAPVVIKLLEGSQGVGVILAETVKMAEAIIETLHSTRQNVIVQKFICESRGRDIRALVVGDKVVAAMRRVAIGQEFRSNVHRGGRVEKVVLDEQFERAAVRAAQIMGLRVAGVDMLEGKDGPLVMEVNSSPGLEGIERATGINVALEIVQYLTDHVQYGDLDIRQRLTLAQGYSVVEFNVSTCSELAGKTLAESGLAERDILILRITRGGLHIPIPKPDGTILPGDALLCYGNHQALRDYLPTLERPEKKKRKFGEGKSTARKRKKKEEEI